MRPNDDPPRGLILNDAIPPPILETFNNYVRRLTLGLGCYITSGWTNLPRASNASARPEWQEMVTIIVQSHRSIVMDISYDLFRPHSDRRMTNTNRVTRDQYHMEGLLKPPWWRPLETMKGQMVGPWTGEPDLERQSEETSDDLDRWARGNMRPSSPWRRTILLVLWIIVF